MMWTLARASLEGALVVAAIWALSRTLTLAPATRTLLWWCAAAKFVLALVWTAPIAIPILPARGASLSPSAAVHVTTTRPSRRHRAAASPSIVGQSPSTSTCARSGWGRARRTAARPR